MATIRYSEAVIHTLAEKGSKKAQQAIAAQQEHKRLSTKLAMLIAGKDSTQLADLCAKIAANYFEHGLSSTGALAEVVQLIDVPGADARKTLLLQEYHELYGAEYSALVPPADGL